MLKSENLLYQKLNNRFKLGLSHKKLLSHWVSYAKEKYDMPEKISTDYLTLRKDIFGSSPFVYFILADAVLPEYELREYFTETEIKELSKTKWHTEKIEFPLRFSMIKVNDEQFIGSISVKTLMLLKDAQLINYNENAQRTMTHIVRGDIEYYQISLNKEAVSAIMNSYENDLYIPNVVTLNLPEDADYYYDNKKKELVIRSTEYLDILDGYHRYIAMSKITSLNPDFDYEMELRIVQFQDDKAKRFIWQEDQKTKMKKVESEAFNTSKASNKIVSRLNNDPSFILSGKISRNNGQINASELSNVIDAVYFKGVKKSEETKVILDATVKLKNGMEILMEQHPDMAERIWDKKHILAYVYLAKHGQIENFDEEYSRLSKVDNIYTGSMITQSDITRLNKLNTIYERGGEVHGSVL
jgi:hypothetical protein